MRDEAPALRNGLAAMSVALTSPLTFICSEISDVRCRTSIKQRASYIEPPSVSPRYQTGRDPTCGTHHEARPFRSARRRNNISQLVHNYASCKSKPTAPAIRLISRTLRNMHSRATTQPTLAPASPLCSTQRSPPRRWPARPERYSGHQLAACNHLIFIMCRVL